MSANRQKPNRKVIVSFMLRFVGETEDDAPELALAEPAQNGEALSGSWRGVVKHIQSGAEHHFTTLAEAEDFMLKYLEK
jgi:hypothetical protein